MGIRATLTVISDRTYRRMKQSALAGQGACIRSCKPYTSFDLDRAWEYIGSALREFGDPLDSALSGDCSANPPTKGIYCHLVSPRLVKQIAAELPKYPYTELAERLVAAAPTFDRSPEADAARRQYLKTHYEHLQSAYALAAARGGAIHIELG